ALSSTRGGRSSRAEEGEHASGRAGGSPSSSGSSILLGGGTSSSSEVDLIPPAIVLSDMTSYSDFATQPRSHIVTRTNGNHDITSTSLQLPPPSAPAPVTFPLTTLVPGRSYGESISLPGDEQRAASRSTSASGSIHRGRHNASNQNPHPSENDQEKAAGYQQQHDGQQVLRSLIYQLLHGLAETHAVGITHRDIKLGNLLVREVDAKTLHLRIADFGSAVFHNLEVH
ncbi:unnamed protein product, partial [Amoebophrya sp. A25]